MDDDYDQPSILKDEQDDLYDDYNYYKNNAQHELKTKLEPDQDFKNKLKTSLNNLQANPKETTTNMLMNRQKKEDTLITSVHVNNDVTRPLINTKNKFINSSINSFSSAHKQTKPISVYSKMDQFDQNLIKEITPDRIENTYINKEKDHIKEEDERSNENTSDKEKQLNDSIEDDEIITLREEININIIDKRDLHRRYILLLKRYNNSQEQILGLNKLLTEERKKQKDVIDMLRKDTTDLKDKKLIDLAKKVSDLNIRIEKYKLQERDLLAKIKHLEATKANNQVSEALKDSKDNLIDMSNPTNLPNKDKALNIDEISLLKKRIKQLEARSSELINKNQQLKTDNSKLESILKKEFGDNYESIINKDNFKGRAETIEVLRGKLKLYEQIINNASFQSNSAQELISQMHDYEGKDINTNNNNNNNSNLIPLSLTNNHISKLSTNVIPFNQYKKEKDEFKKEIQVLLQEKEKVNIENNKLKSRKDVLEKELKSQKESLTSKLKILLEKNDNDEKLINALNRELEKKTGKSITGEDIQFNLKQEIVGLRDQLKDKTTQIEKLESKILGTGKSDISLLGLLEKIEYLEQENKELKCNTGEGKIYEALAKENASLRLKLLQKNN